MDNINFIPLKEISFFRDETKLPAVPLTAPLLEDADYRMLHIAMNYGNRAISIVSGYYIFDLEGSDIQFTSGSSIRLLGEYQQMPLGEAITLDKKHLSTLMERQISSSEYGKALLAAAVLNMKENSKMNFRTIMIDYNAAEAQANREVFEGVFLSKHPTTEIAKAMANGLPVREVPKLDSIPTSYVVEYSKMYEPRVLSSFTTGYGRMAPTQLLPRIPEQKLVQYVSMDEVWN